MDSFTWSVIEQQKTWLDQSSDLPQTELIKTHILKVVEEIGEATAALAGATATNPRKGLTHDMDDVAAELADVAIAALVSLAAITEDPRGTLAQRLAHVYTRSLNHGAAPLPPAGFNPDRASWLASLPRSLAATVMLLTDAENRLLLVKQPYRPEPRNWNLPGGGLDDDEPPRAGAIREVAEEIALAIEPGRLLTLNWNRATDRPPLIVYLYDGGVLTPAQISQIRLLDGELSDHGFFTLEQAEALMTTVAHRELAAALDVRANRFAFAELQDGNPVMPQPGVRQMIDDLELH